MPWPLNGLYVPRYSAVNRPCWAAMKTTFRVLAPSVTRATALVLLLLIIAGCGKTQRPENTAPAAADQPLTVGVWFETLQNEFWVAALKAFESESNRRHIQMLQAIADGDAHRQIEQVRNFITRRVDGIILVPKDARACLPVIRAAHAAKIPIVLLN